MTRLRACTYWKNRDWVINADRPFFHIVSFLNPHDHYFYDPRDSVSGFSRPWPKDDEKSLTAPATRRVDWEEEQWGAYFRFYESLIERVDRDIAETLHQFRCSGFFSNSWIIFSTDHGDMAGEHDLPFKGPFMYDGVTRVPLVIVPPRHAFGGPGVHRVPDPGISPGRREHLASHADIVPTVLDLAGVAPSPDLSGRSLLPIVRDASAAPVRQYAFSEWAKPPTRMCRSLEWKYVLYLNGEEQLFDLKADPNELHNLAALPAHAARKKELRAELEAHFARTGDPFHTLP
jgi:arylsulfatase A-like enzyme